MSSSSASDLEKTPPPAALAADSRDWTDAEESKAKKKLDFLLLPLLCLAFVSLQMDRSNISSAATGTFFKDVGITSDDSNNGQSLLLVMIVVFEIPSNIILQLISPAKWLGFQAMAWALVATFQAFISTRGGFYATRLLLGICESGFIPGSVYYLSQLYTSREFAQRAAYFWIGGLCGKAASPLIASRLLIIRIGSFKGWQNLFLIEGLMGIFIALLLLLFLPPSINNSQTLIPGVRWFNDREAHILSRRVLIDDPKKAGGDKIRIKVGDIIKVLKNWRTWLLIAWMIAFVAPGTAIALYNARTVKALGFSVSRANALASVGVWAGIIPTAFSGWLADRTQKRGLVTAVFTLPFLILLPIFWHLQAASTVTTSHKWANYGLFETLLAFLQPSFININAWAAMNSFSPVERSITSCMLIMASNGAQAIGSQMFRASDAPRYLNGTKAAIALYYFSFLVALLLWAVFAWSNRYGKGYAGRELSSSLSSSSASRREGVEEEEEQVLVKTFKYSV